ncbi:hypothetical protein QJ854_gp095 [Moumouvirus goulette]|uniref:Uncharacterized protein n=1 Tax=Moumouvirus goulette TaxID=1247379 RepID=M1PY28_9VIRU|nr:hypothetical protein QJ854_gp095 [Moumouvirus goulette]AGF85687.1 hypothetical protein glt_00884 [Moumouvirus goulette]
MNRNYMLIFNKSKILTSRYIYTHNNRNMNIIINKKEENHYVEKLQESLFGFMDGFTNGCIFGSVSILYFINT